MRLSDGIDTGEQNTVESPDGVAVQLRIEQWLDFQTRQMADRQTQGLQLFDKWLMLPGRTGYQYVGSCSHDIDSLPALPEFGASQYTCISFLHTKISS